MSEELEVLRVVVERLDAAGVDYMLTGSLAMAWYAQPRQTRDIDMDLVLAKLGWAALGESDLQLRDVRNVLRSVPDLNEAYLSGWAQKLGLVALLQKATSP